MGLFDKTLKKVVNDINEKLWDRFGGDFKSPQNPKPIINEVVKNEVIDNGLSDVLFGQGFNIPQQGAQISQWDTLFVNLRWYLVSNNRQLLSQAYAELGLVKAVVDIPVDDGFRGGVEIKSEQLSPDELQTLMEKMASEDDLGIFKQASKWNRLYGGAGVMVITDQNAEQELNIEDIKQDSPLTFRAVDMWELFFDKQNAEGYQPEVQEEEYEFYSYYSKKIHKSRVMKMKGLIPPSFIRPRLRGWGMSELEILIRSINQYLKSNTLTFEVLDEFKVDYFKIKNLNNTLLRADGTAQVQKRIEIANRQKNYLHAVVADSEDDFQQKELSFTGLAETMTQIRMQVASDLRMPLTKLFGVSAAGFSSGEDDIENYNAMVESQVREKCKFHLLQVIQIRCQQMFGYIPTDLMVDFKPLRVLSAEQEENVKSQKFQRVFQALQAGAMTPVEFKQACNKENLLSVQLDTTIDVLTPAQDDGPNKDTSQGFPEAKKAPKSTMTAKTAMNAENPLEPVLFEEEAI